MMKFYGSKKVVAQFANEVLLHLESGLQSITITKLDTFGDYSVSIVTDTSSEGIVKTMAQIYSVALLNTSPRNTLGG